MISLVAIGASAGGFDTLLQLISNLKPGYPAAIVIVLHIPSDSRSLLAETFASRTQMPVREPEDKEDVKAGTIYVAPSGYHLLLERDRTFSLTLEPPVHYSRPSIDVLFESAAVAYGKQCAGIILTGANQDGASGLRRIVDRGGLGIVQNPETAPYDAMPRSAIEFARPQLVLDLPEIIRWINKLDVRTDNKKELNS